MTTISATTYSPYYSTTTTSTAVATTTASTSSSTGSSAQSATNVTLSDAAKAALAQVDFGTIIAQTRAALDALFADGTKPADADLSKLDRRQLFAISSNANNQFSADEQAAAKTEQQNRLDAALTGPLAVARVTDDIENIYTAALAYLDGASTEEKATPTWTAQRDALLDAQKQLAANPNATPAVDGDIVADFIKRATAGDTGALRDFSDVATDARAALDAQYASAKAAGKDLTFNGVQKKGHPVDFSQFDSRSLSAIALNQDGKFSVDEVLAAKQAVSQRSSATVLAGLKAAASDPASFAKNLLSAYASMSPEERSAAGWTDKLYNAAVANYRTASQLANIFGDANSDNTGSSGALSLLDVLNQNGSSGTSGTNMSLADILNQAGA
jgi:hypothetical protein